MADQPHVTETGEGTDLYIRKVAPGSQFGQGYIVDIYDYGEKVDEVFVRTKKEVYQLVREQKDRYHTDKAFENMQHLHVTFKSPGEQGFSQQKESSLQGDTTMHIDEILLRKANHINNLLATLKDPSIPKKVIKNAEVEDEQQGIVQQLKEELVTYFTNLDKDPNSQGYNSYNEIKEWLEKVRTLLTESNANQGTNYDVNAITESLKNIFKNSGLPGEDVLFKSACIECDKLVSELNAKKDNIHSVGKVLEKGVSESVLENISERPDKNEVETLVSKLHKSCLVAQKLQEEFNVYEENFWKHISNFKGISPIQVVYADWEKTLVLDENSKSLLQTIILSGIEQNFKNITRTAETIVPTILQKSANYVLLPFLFNFKFAQDPWTTTPEILQETVLDAPINQEQSFLDIIDELFDFNTPYLQRLRQPLDDRVQHEIAQETLEKYQGTSNLLGNMSIYSAILQTYIEQAVKEYISTIYRSNPQATLEQDFTTIFEDLKVHRIIEDLISSFRILVNLKYTEYIKQYPQFQTYFTELKNYIASIFSANVRNLAQDEDVWYSIIQNALEQQKSSLRNEGVDLEQEFVRDTLAYIEQQLKFGTTIIINESDEEGAQDQIKIPSLNSKPTGLENNPSVSNEGPLHSSVPDNVQPQESIQKPVIQKQAPDINSTPEQKPIDASMQPTTPTKQEGKVLLDVLKG